MCADYKHHEKLSVPECQGKHYAKGFCEKHYRRWKRGPGHWKSYLDMDHCLFCGDAIYAKRLCKNHCQQHPDTLQDDYGICQNARKRTWKGDGDNFVFQNKEGRPIHRHTLNQRVIKPTLEKIGVTTPISIKDTRASYITNALDENERMSFVRQQVGHSSNRMIMDHYYRDTPAPDDGSKLKNAWNSTRILPESETPSTS